jgi:flagellar export protein FliJ
MAKNPWPLLLKLAQNEADTWAKRAAELKAQLDRFEAQAESLASAANHYQVQPQQSLPISLLRNQLGFKGKLDKAIVDLGRQVAQTRAEWTGAIAQWSSAQAKADGFEKLADAAKEQRRIMLDKADQQNLEEMAQTTLRAKQSGSE